MNEYDVRKAFEEMELELIASMKRNLQRHLDWENDEGFNWNMWQVEQLKTLENFKKENKKIFNKKFSSINASIAKFIVQNYQNSAIKEELGILDQLAKGEYVKGSIEQGLGGAFFSLNKKKMNALIKATTDDIKKAEHAMLRMTNDQYRKTIFNAQVMANSGAFTLEQSIDKATKDFLRAGINCIQYKDGRRVNIASYAEMAIRTANKRAMLISEGDVRKAYGIHTVRISKYGQCSETCLPWQGKIYVDDVYSGGTKEEAQEKKLTLLSEAIAGGLFHPNCKHRATTYFYDLKKSLGKLKDDGIENPPEEQEHRKNKLHIQQQKRLEIGLLDSTNIEQAKVRKEEWIEKDEKLGYDLESKDDTLIVEGKNIVGKFKPQGIYQYDIEDIINQQGFDGMPRIVDDIDKFYEAIEDDHFIAERTFSSNESTKQINDWYEQLKSGDFYVKCTTGGFQYGRGMYCAADYTKGTIDFSKFKHEIDQYAWEKKYAKTVWLTVDPSAKIIDFNDIQFEYACEWIKNKYPEKATKINHLRSINKQVIDFPRTWDPLKDPTPQELIDLRKKFRDIEKEVNIREGYSAANERIKNDGYDWGILAAEMGYDVINGLGHGATGSYTVILNRTKLVIYDGKNFKYRKR